MKSSVQKIILIISVTFNIAFITVCGITYLSWASSGNESRVNDNGGDPWWARNGLDLSETQKQSFQEGDTNLVKQVKETDKRIAEYRAQLLKLIANEDAPRYEIEALLKEITELQYGAQMLVVDSLVSKRKALDNQQKQEFFGSLHKRMRCDWEERGWDNRGWRSNKGCGCGWCD